MKPYFSVNIKLKHKNIPSRSPISFISIPPSEKHVKFYEKRKSFENLRLKSRPKSKLKSFLQLQGVWNHFPDDSTSGSPVVRSLTPDLLKDSNHLVFFKRGQVRGSNKSLNILNSKGKKVDPDLPQIHSGCFVSHFNKKTLKHSWALDLSSENYRKHVRKLKDLFNLR